MFFKSKSGGYDYLIAGLGNPGKEYENTRHNAGFVVADKILQKYGASLNKKKFDCFYGQVKIGDKRILIAKPQTFMNLSGRAVSPLAKFYKIPNENIIVIFDDISLDVGRIRIRRKGSDGGHNGMKDIIRQLSSQDIMRIKIGVGEKPHPDYDLKDWVLGKIPKEQLSDFNSAADNAVLAVEEIIVNGIDSAMNKYSK